MASLNLVSPALAEVRVDNIVVNQSAPLPEATNLRVNLINDGSQTEYPLRVDLQVRASQEGPWSDLKSWNLASRQMKLAAGERLSLDYLPLPGQSLHPALLESGYEVRALVTNQIGQMTSYDHVHIAP